MSPRECERSVLRMPTRFEALHLDRHPASVKLKVLEPKEASGPPEGTAPACAPRQEAPRAALCPDCGPRAWAQGVHAAGCSDHKTLRDARTQRVAWPWGEAAERGTVSQRLFSAQDILRPVPSAGQAFLKPCWTRGSAARCPGNEKPDKLAAF